MKTSNYKLWTVSCFTWPKIPTTLPLKSILIIESNFKSSDLILILPRLKNVHSMPSLTQLSLSTLPSDALHCMQVIFIT